MTIKLTLKQQILFLLLFLSTTNLLAQNETQNPGSPFWRTTGNTGVGTVNFLGTTNNSSLRFRTNNTQKAILDSIGNLGIGTASPSEKLEVVGNFKLSQAFMPGGSAGTSGQFLLSGGPNAAATWSPFTIGNPTATSVIAKYYALLAWPGTWSNAVTYVFTVIDPSCREESSISVSFTGTDPILDKISINNVQTDNGSFNISLTNRSGGGITGAFAIGYIAFY